MTTLWITEIKWSHYINEHNWRTVSSCERVITCRTRREHSLFRIPYKYVVADEWWRLTAYSAVSSNMPTTK